MHSCGMWRGLGEMLEVGSEIGAEGVPFGHAEGTLRGGVEQRANRGELERGAADGAIAFLSAGGEGLGATDAVSHDVAALTAAAMPCQPLTGRSRG